MPLWNKEDRKLISAFGKNACTSLFRMIRRRLPDPRSRWLASKYLIGDKYRRIYHYHIRKTAGTSLDAAFWNLADVKLLEFGKRSQICKNGMIIVRGMKNKIQDGHYFYASSHIPAHALKLPEYTFTITLLRNPLDRLLSYYRYLLWATNDPLAHNQEPFLSELQPETPCAKGSFADFLDQVDKDNLLSQLYMFSRSYDVCEAKDRILACSAVGFTENFDQSLRQISQRLNLPLKVQQERRFEYQISPSLAELRRARELLEPEFRLVREVREVRQNLTMTPDPPARGDR